MMPSLYASGAFALRESNDFLSSTHTGYRKLIRKAKCKPKHKDDTLDIYVAIGPAARKVHACKRAYLQNPSLDGRKNWMFTKAATRQYYPLRNCNWSYHPQRSRLGASGRCMKNIWRRVERSPYVLVASYFSKRSS